MNDPTRKRRGFTYAGDCGDFAPEPARKHLALAAVFGLALFSERQMRNTKPKHRRGRLR